MKYIQLLLLLLSVWACSTKSAQKIELSGEWQFKLDSLDVGITERWYSQDLDHSVRLPGSMVENGKGFDITPDTKWTGGIRNPEWYKDSNYAPYFDPDNVKFPFWLQPQKKYTGAAWYQRKVTIPKNWKGKSIWLNLERPHWETTVWVNGKKAGQQNSLATPHKYDITSLVRMGDNFISVRVDNRTKDVDVGWNSHSITDHTQTNWNGIVGDISLQSADQIHFKSLKVFPDLKSNIVDIKAVVNNTSSKKKDIKIEVEIKLKKTDREAGIKQYKFTIPAGESTVNLECVLNEKALTWDEFDPNLYALSAEIDYPEGKDKQSVDFGFRNFEGDSTGFSINGHRTFLRGTLDCAIFPKTGYPPTNVKDWKKEFTAIKSHGLNHVRFHSWCPPEAAFVAADEMGVYLQVECSSWANQSTQLGSGLPIDQYIYDESKRIVDAYGNHPSFVMMAYGNEPGGPNYTTFLRKFVTYWEEQDDRRLYTTAAGWPVISESDYHLTSENVRIQGWGEELKSIINSQQPKTTYDWSEGIKNLKKPMVSHEIGQWCVYPNFKEIKKYTGVLKAKNFELFQESLSAHHMGQLADSLLLASGKLQALCYKADIEAALRTPNFGGFQLLGLQDFPGQGTALVGVLDAFWKEKGYISPEEFRHFCNSTVPLARLDKRVFREDETFTANIEVAHFGESPLKNVSPHWKIYQNEKIIAEGTLGQQDIPLGNANKLGKVVYQFQKENKPRKLTLEVSIKEYQNSWDIWVYPASPIKLPKNIEVVEDLSPSVFRHLEDGGKVLLSLGKGKVTSNMGGDVGVGFSSIFWNTAWTGGQKPHTLGILCDPEHPALELFPTEYHSNWQWWDAMSHSDAIQLDSFATDLKPIVRIIDDWVSNRRLALLFEAKVGKGSIFISGVDLVNHLADRPEADQMKKSLLHYMASDRFHPTVELSVSQLNSIIK
ncbi:beta-galactosidase [Christiangramia fulva]|uniref:beta-galactosidase n=1 Tax=Christiangramia fulva TaxID=2126553 RepID=A0A2R3ZBG0_9FLAO|nr:sugar-binding domain-containing protein [Christiangramia fulva]AVR47552.1 beta-galactosidase [Christiangramia fulva]